MATPFAARAARLAASLNKAFGESFTFLPFTSPPDVNLSKIPDLTRSQFVAVGQWEGATKSDTPHARGATQDDNAHNWNASRPSILVEDAALIWIAARGDRVVRQFDQSVWEVSTPEPDGFGFTRFLLTARK